LYLPASHDLHTPPSGPDHPALQVQFVVNMLPLGDMEPAGQLTQTPDPVICLYLPASHAAQGPPSDPDHPALHLQSVIAILPVGETE
jgi:hypothetical protein